MNFKEIKKLLQENGVNEEALDDLVHNEMLFRACQLNNEGFDAQLTFLIQAIGKEEVLKSLGIKP